MKSSEADASLRSLGLRPTLPDWAVVGPERRAHIERVAELAARWAEAIGVPDNERHRWLRAVWLHDALRDAPKEELERWAPSIPGPRSMLHGPASAARAKAEGETDRGVLDAVRYHSVGLTEWDNSAIARHGVSLLREVQAGWLPASIRRLSQTTITQFRP